MKRKLQLDNPISSAVARADGHRQTVVYILLYDESLSQYNTNHISYIINHSMLKLENELINGLVFNIPEYLSRDQLDLQHSISVDFTHPNCVLNRKDNRFYLLSYHYDTHSNIFLVFGLLESYLSGPL